MKAKDSFFWIIRRLAVAVMAVVLVACAQSADNIPSSVKYHSYKPKSQNRYQAPKASNQPFHVSVGKGDTLYDVAKRNSSHIRELIEINDLEPPYQLYVGQRLKLPKALYHLVENQDTLYSISRSYEIDLSQLIQTNHLQEPFTIFPGQKLNMPSKTRVSTPSQNLHASTQKASSSNQPIKANTRFKVASQTLTDPNTPVSSLKSKAAHPTPMPKALPRPSSSRLTSGSKKTQFHWPIRGKITSSFGPKKGGLYNDGINISAPRGSAIKAAASGKVVYAGNELKGYGNLLLIRHDNGFLTAYAHTERNVVTKGSGVKLGQVIGYVGSTGHVKSPQLHFSIRRGRKAFDPEKFLTRMHSAL